VRDHERLIEQGLEGRRHFAKARDLLGCRPSIAGS
jgi:hypothetical protein